MNPPTIFQIICLALVLSMYSVFESKTEAVTVQKLTSEGQDGETGAFTDPRDGQTYQWVRIGDQVWMTENLRYLPAVTGPGSGSSTTPYYYVYDYNGMDINAAKATANYQHYGVLYNWAAVMDGASSSSANPSGVQGVCPPGWHVPSDAEWSQLVDYVVSKGYPNADVVHGAGNALKSCRQVDSPLMGACNTSEHPRWNPHHTYYGTDEFGFSALPGGYRNARGSFRILGIGSRWWSSTESSSTFIWARLMGYGGGIGPGGYDRSCGFSIRCVRDN